MAAFPLNNVTTADAYSDANSAIMSPPKRAVTMVVTGASVYYQIQPYQGVKGDSGQWNAEAFAPPGRYTFDEDDWHPVSALGAGVRVRSAVAGTPAQVTVH